MHTRLAANQAYTTLELTVAYHKAIPTGTGRLRAEVRVVSVDKHAAFAAATLTGKNDRFHASITSTQRVMERGTP